MRIPSLAHSRRARRLAPIAIAAALTATTAVAANPPAQPAQPAQPAVASPATNAVPAAAKPASAAAPAENVVYKWKDAHGVSQYTQQPPPKGVKYETVQMTGTVNNGLVPQTPEGKY